MLNELRHAIRAILRRPGFAAVVVLTMALGIGANALIFSVVNGVLLRPLPYADSDRLLVIWGKYPQTGITNTSLPDFLDYKAQATRVSEMAAFSSAGFNLAGEGTPERAQAGVVTANFFHTLGLAPAAGRAFRADEERGGAPKVAMVSWEYWQRRFGGDASLIGKSLELNGRPYEIVGVAPRGIAYPAPVDVYVPLRTDTTLNRRNEFLDVIARLVPGATVEQASTEMTTIALRLAQQYPQTNRTIRTEVLAMRDQVTGKARPALLVFMAAVGLVLLVACGNVANLLLARAVGREREIAIRSALGASRKRIFSQLVTESLVLALASGLAGVLLTVVGVRALRASKIDALPRLSELSVDGRVLLFALGVSVLTGMLFGLAPALRLAGENLQGALRGGGRGLAGTAGVQRLRGALVLGEVALAVMLLVGAGLLLRSFVALQRVDPGFDPDGVLTARISLTPSKYPFERILPTWQQLGDRMAAVPGVRSVGLASSVPMAGVGYWSFQIEGKPSREDVMQDVQPYSVTPGYFAAMRMQLVRGRLIEDRDRDTVPRVAVINETMARKFWGGEDPIGARFTVGDTTEYMTIVGIVKDAKQEGVGDEAYAQMYRPLSQGVTRNMYVVARTAGDPEAITAALRRTLGEIDPQLPVYDVRTMQQRLAGSVARPRLTAMLTGIFAATALLLAAIGIYGVVAYSVAQRQRELGVRMALGATGGDVLALVTRQGMTPVLAGLTLGLAGAWAGGRLLGSLLYGVRANDPWTFFVVAGFLGAVALFATLLPARRATMLSPTMALREE